jgi:hypothetical protein
MLDLRIYRAAFVPILFVLVVVAFSLQTRPNPIQTALPPDAFDAARAFRLLDDLAERYPERAPGSQGDLALAGAVQRAFQATDFEVTTTDVKAETVDGERTLRTIVAARPGRVNRAIVVLTHRDAQGAPAKASLSATAALLELARLLNGRTTRRTVVLVSTSGGSGGNAGAEDWAKRVQAPVDAVLVLGDMAGVTQRRPQVVGWSNTRGIAPQRLMRTVEQAVGVEAGVGGSGSTRTIMQALRLAFPFTVSEQGVIGAQGLPAVLLSASGELGPAPGAAVSEVRMEGMGRALLRSLTALDEGPDVVPDRPQSEVQVRNQLLPLWAVRLLGAAAFLPPLLAAIDGLARVRRRREAILPWLAWILAIGSPLLAAGLVLMLLRVVGLVTAPPAPVFPGAIGVSVGVLVVAVAVVILGYLMVWPLLRRLAPTAGGGGGGIALALLSQLLAWIVWIGNPYAALFLVPAVHLWLLAVAPEMRGGRGWRLAFVVAPAIPFALAALAYLVALNTDPVQLGWIGLLAIAGGHVSPLSLVVWSLLIGCGLAALIIALATEPVRPERKGVTGPDQVLSRGPLTYAGPGSLGGTDSARRR